LGRDNEGVERVTRTYVNCGRREGSSHTGSNQKIGKKFWGEGKKWGDIESCAEAEKGHWSLVRRKEKSLSGGRWT